MTELLSTHSRTNVLEQGPSPARGQGARLLGAGAVFEWRPRLWPATSVRLGESHSRGVGFDSGLSAAADHLDRSRGILCGCAGEIVGWVWPVDAVGGASQEATKIWNELPACILVRFKTKTTWRVEGIDEDNVFPVAPQKKPWYLDKGRRRPVLRVTRKQFPLAPGFATTAHAAQGQTCKEGVVMDMHIGDTGGPLTAYIAL